MLLKFLSSSWDKQQILIGKKMIGIYKEFNKKSINKHNWKLKIKKDKSSNSGKFLEYYKQLASNLLRH